MFRIKDIDHIVLRVSELPRMIDFYCKVVGCGIEWDRPDLGLVHLRAGSALIDLVSVDGPTGKRGGAGPGAEGHNMDHVCLRIHDFDIDAAVRHLESHGVKPGKITSRFGADGRGISVYLNDPEGNTVELKGTRSDQEAVAK